MQIPLTSCFILNHFSSLKFSLYADSLLSPLSVFYLPLRTAIPLFPVRQDRLRSASFGFSCSALASQRSLAAARAVINYMLVTLCITLTLTSSPLLPQEHLTCNMLSSELMVNFIHLMNIC